MSVSRVSKSSFPAVVCGEYLRQMRIIPNKCSALAGLSLSDYLIREARKIVERPSNEEIFSRLGRRARVTPRISPADAVRRERDGR